MITNGQFYWNVLYIHLLSFDLPLPHVQYVQIHLGFVSACHWEKPAVLSFVSEVSFCADVSPLHGLHCKIVYLYEKYFYDGLPISARPIRQRTEFLNYWQRNRRYARDGVFCHTFITYNPWSWNQAWIEKSCVEYRQTLSVFLDTEVLALKSDKSL